jgi:hypothetical protein
VGRRRVKGQLTWYVLDLDEWPRPRPAPKVVIWVPARTVNVLVDGVFQECSESLLPGYALVASRLHWSKVEELIRVRLVRGVHGPVAVPLGDVVKLRQREESEVWQCVELPVSDGCRVVLAKSQEHRFGNMAAVYRGLVMTCGGFFAKVDVDVPGAGTIRGQYVPYDCVVPVGD